MQVAGGSSLAEQNMNMLMMARTMGPHADASHVAGHLALHSINHFMRHLETAGKGKIKEEFWTKRHGKRISGFSSKKLVFNYLNRERIREFYSAVKKIKEEFHRRKAGEVAKIILEIVREFKKGLKKHNVKEKHLPLKEPKAFHKSLAVIPVHAKGKEAKGVLLNEELNTSLNRFATLAKAIEAHGQKGEKHLIQEFVKDEKRLAQLAAARTATNV
jgi:hypothetical protein